jgi:hypothetical protein
MKDLIEGSRHCRYLQFIIFLLYNLSTDRRLAPNTGAYPPTSLLSIEAKLKVKLN